MWFQARCETCLAEKSKPHLETHVCMQYVFVFLCALGIRLAPQSQAIACARHRRLRTEACLCKILLAVLFLFPIGSVSGFLCMLIE